MNKMELTALALVVATALSACGGGGESSPQTAPLTLSVTDSPIDPTQIEDVCIRFTRITMHYAGQEEVTLDYNPLPSQVRSDTHCMTGAWNGQAPVPPVRLNMLGGPLTVALAESLQVPVGRVTWIRLHFASGSYVLEENGAQQELRCPSCEPTDNNTGRGFKLNRTFEVKSGGLALIVDIDLLSSLLHQNSTEYVLRPTARIENTAALGTIAGVVDAGRIASPYNGTTVETGCAVYVFEGFGATLDDHHLTSTVLSSARVRYSEVLGQYGYAVGALPGGTVAQPAPYTVALTCDFDDPMVNDDPAVVDPMNDVMFSPGKDAGVVVGQVTSVDFGP